MDIVYAQASAHVGGPDDMMVFVQMGTHWPATDPVVTRNPWLFSTDPQFGLRYSVLPATPPESVAVAAGGGKRGPGRPPLPRAADGSIIR